MNELDQLHYDLNEALLRLKEVQRDAQKLCGPQAPTDLSPESLLERIVHLDSEMAALVTVFQHRGKLMERIVEETKQLTARVERLESFQTKDEPIILKVVKQKKRTVGKNAP